MDLENLKLHSGSHIPVSVLDLLYIYTHSYKEKKTGSFMLQWSTVCYFSLIKLPGELPLLVYIDPPFSFKLMQNIPYYQPGLIRPFSIDGQLGCFHVSLLQWTLLFFVLLITVNAKHLLDIDNCLEPVDTETAASYFSERGFKSSGWKRIYKQ